MKSDGKIHLGTLGMGIPVIYSTVVSKVFSTHLAVESVLVKYLAKHSLKEDRGSFRSRLRVVVHRLGEAADDWSIEACLKLNDVRNKCGHIDDEHYKDLALRIQAPLDDLITLVKARNLRRETFQMSDFEWAGIMIYQRLHQLLELPYDPLVLGEYSSLPEELRRYFSEPR